MANPPTMWRLALRGTGQHAIEPTPRPQTDHTRTGQYRTGRTCQGQNGNGVLRTGDSTVRTPADDHNHENNNTPHLYQYTTDQPTTTTYYEPPASRESAGSTESGGGNTRHEMRVP